MNKRQAKKNQGFSILEVVVAILIITIGLVGVMSLVMQNLRAQYINKNILVAAGLAQEGLELVRNIRDTNWLISGNSWKRDLVADGTYAIDYNGRSSLNATVDSIADAGARLYLSGSGLYTHVSAGATPTNFYRLITVVDNGDNLEIKCTIRWAERNGNHSHSATTHLYNWR